jgi:Ca2+-binding EF-hand superfamily protein
MQAVGIKKVDAGEIFAKIDEDGSDEIDKMEFSKFFSLDENEALCRKLSGGAIYTSGATAEEMRDMAGKVFVWMDKAKCGSLTQEEFAPSLVVLLVLLLLPCPQQQQTASLVVYSTLVVCAAGVGAAAIAAAFLTCCCVRPLLAPHARAIQTVGYTACKKRARDLFTKIDLDESNLINQDEFAQYFMAGNEEGLFRKLVAGRLFDLIDTSKDGDVSKDEMITAFLVHMSRCSVTICSAMYYNIDTATHPCL